MGSGSKSSVTIGYKYYMGFHLVVCHGPVDEFLAAKYAERDLWTGSVTSNTDLTIDKPGLLGGEKQEGGVSGIFSILFGDAAQGRNAYLQSKVDSAVSAYRHVVSVVANQVYYAAMNPYVKDFYWRFRRTTTREYQWYDAKADIGGHMNPAHILVDCLTNSAWGLGISTNVIDTVSFEAAADTLFTEGFGLSFVYRQQSSIFELMTDVIRHVEGALYVDGQDGKFHFDLIRNDYVFEDLQVLDETNIVSVSKYESAVLSNTINEVVINFTDDATGETDTTSPIQNLGNIQAQGRVVSKALTYAGIYDKDLAVSVGMRDLRSLSTPLRKITLTANKIGYNIKPGTPIVVNWAEDSISGMVLRVMSVTGGGIQNPTYELSLLEDVFGQPLSNYTTPQDTEWVDPASAMTDLAAWYPIEAPYYLAATTLASADLDALNVLYGFGHLVSKRDSGAFTGYSVYTSPDGVSYSEGSALSGFCPSATVAGDYSQVDTAFTYDTDIDMDLVSVGDAGYLVTDASTYEMVSVTAVDSVARTISLARGILDTVPLVTPDNTRLFITEEYYGLDGEERVESETTYYKLLPRGPGGELPEADATGKSVVFNARGYRPYPPANVVVDSQSAFSSGELLSASFFVTWNSRSRLLQLAGYESWSAAVNYTLEVGTTFTVEIYHDDTEALLYTETGITGLTSASITLAEGEYPVRVEVTAHRDGYDCLFPYIATFSRKLIIYNLTAVPSASYDLTETVWN
jgi:hypothetical protein